MIETLKYGLNDMVEDVIYATPERRCLLFTAASSPTITQSNDADMDPSVAVTLSGGQAEIGGAFVQCTTGSITVCIKSS